MGKIPATKPKFTQEEIDILASNPYTLSVSEVFIKFTPAFKAEFWRRYKAGETNLQIVRALGYEPEILGRARIIGIRRNIENEVKSKKGIHNTGKKCVGQDYTDLGFTEALYAMQGELQYLRQEIEFVKKIIAAENGRGRKR